MESGIDSNALSALADSQPAAACIFTQAASIEVPVIVLSEYRFGIAYSRRRKEYEKCFEELIDAIRVLHVDLETSAHYAQIRGELKRPVGSSRQPIPGSPGSRANTGSR